MTTLWALFALGQGDSGKFLQHTDIACLEGEALVSSRDRQVTHRGTISTSFLRVRSHTLTRNTYMLLPSLDVKQA